jgi:dTDP-4-dehydrorhamnose reductase
LKVLIIGGGGMLGHRLFAHLRPSHDTRVTLHRGVADYSKYGLFDRETAYPDVDAADTDRLFSIVSEFRPEAIVNCVGIVKQLSIAKESIPSLEVNALLPHRLALIARSVGARVVHFSTDCVFSGRRGNYAETDMPDPEDLYGRTKLLGELDQDGCITLRTSLIGHELERKTSLLEWFLAQKARIRGFRKAVFSGFTTIEAARIVETLIVRHPEASGVWHVSSDPIDKYTLLNLIKKHYGLDTEIEVDDEFHCDRSLNSARFRERFQYSPPRWESMIEEMSKLRGVQR